MNTTPPSPFLWWLVVLNRFNMKLEDLYHRYKCIQDGCVHVWMTRAEHVKIVLTSYLEQLELRQLVRRENILPLDAAGHIRRP